MVVMLLFADLTYEDPNAEPEPELEYNRENFFEILINMIEPMSLLSAECIAVFSYIYSLGANFFVDKYNYKYKKDYNDHLRT